MNATVEERIESVMPMIRSRSIRFVRSLSARKRANYGVDDTISQLWLALRVRDDKYRPADGDYVAFARRIIRNELCDILDRSGTVQAPRNHTDRLKEYQKESDAGTITPARAATFELVRRVSAGQPFRLAEDSDKGHDRRPDVVAEGNEEARHAVRVMVEAIGSLTPREARVIGMKYGLWGQPERTLGQIAAETGWKPGTVKNARRSAHEKIKARLLASGHPAVASLN